MREVNVYCAWKDQLDEEAELRAQGRGLGLQPADVQQDNLAAPPRRSYESDEDDAAEEPNHLKVNQRSKAIKKQKKTLRQTHLDEDESESEDSDDAYGGAANGHKIKQRSNNRYNEEDESDKNENI